MLKNRLKSLRHKYEMNQKEFAEFLGFNPAQLSRWENQTQQPTIETGFKICRKLNITMEELFDYQDS